MKRRLVAGSVIALLVTSTPAFAEVRDRDTAWGRDGRARIEAGDDVFVPHTLALRGDDTVLVGGERQLGVDDSTPLLAVVDPTGSATYVDFGDTDGAVVATSFAPNGVAAGAVEGGDGVTVFRLDGAALDPGFDAPTFAGATIAGPNAVLSENDAVLLVTTSGPNAVVTRFVADGSLDATFGTNGSAVAVGTQSDPLGGAAIYAVPSGYLLIADNGTNAGSANAVLINERGVAGVPVAIPGVFDVDATAQLSDGSVLVFGSGADGDGVLDVGLVAASGVPVAEFVGFKVPDRSSSGELAASAYRIPGKAWLAFSLRGGGFEVVAVDVAARTQTPRTITGETLEAMAVSAIDGSFFFLTRPNDGEAVDLVKTNGDGRGRFLDDDDSMFETEIDVLAGSGVTAGCNPPLNTEFCPTDTVTRGQMAAFLVRALGLTDPGDVDFADDNDSVFEADIARLANAGITRGCNPPDNDLFCPDDPVTRGQMAAFLVRALGLTDPGDGEFSDDDGSVFEEDIARLAHAGVTRGCNPPDNDRFCPNDEVTRGEMAAFLVRAIPGLRD